MIIKLLNAIGMAFKSSNITSGTKLFDAVINQKVKLVIIAKDMGVSQKKKLTDKCKFYNIKFYDDLLTVEQLSKATGKKTLVAIGINNLNFINLFETIINEKERGTNNG